MLHTLAQSTYTYTTTTTDDASAGLLAGTFLVVLFVVLLPLIIFSIVCLWKVFEKAGVEGWKSIIPVYNFWVLCEIAGKPGWWSLVVLLGAIPLVNFVAWIAILVVQIIVSIELSKRFGKDSAFAILLILLPVVGYAILAFGKATYKGSAGGPAKPVAPANA